MQDCDITTTHSAAACLLDRLRQLVIRYASECLVLLNPLDGILYGQFVHYDPESMDEQWIPSDTDPLAPAPRRTVTERCWPDSLKI
jgi:hypothetical protein